MSNLLSEKLTAKEILVYANMASYSYSTETEIKSKYGDTYRIVVVATTETDGQCVLLFDDTNKIQYIVTRGSSNLENWIKDTEYAKTLDTKTGIYIHSGFLESAIEIYNNILSNLNTAYTTYLIGHSLGGAITVVLHFYLLKDGFNIKQSVTFGQPMITNYVGVSKYRSIPLLRVVNKKDLVPLLPPLTAVSSESGPYRHFGEETILLKDTYYCNLDETSAEDSDVSDFWLNLLNGETDITDHFINNYLSNLQAKLSECTEVAYNERSNYFA